MQRPEQTTAPNPFAPPLAPVERPPSGGDFEALPWWVVRRNFAPESDETGGPRRLFEETGAALPEATALWLVLVLYAMALAGLRGGLMLESFLAHKLPLAGLRLFFPTTNIEFLLLLALVAAAVRHLWLRRSAIRRSALVLRSMADASQPRELLLEHLGLGWSITWRLQIINMSVTYVALSLGGPKTVLQLMAAGSVAMVPLAIVFMRQAVRRLFGPSAQISMWAFLWRGAVAALVLRALDEGCQWLSLAVRGTAALHLWQWTILLATLIAIKCVGFGWAALRAVVPSRLPVR